MLCCVRIIAFGSADRPHLPPAGREMSLSRVIRHGEVHDGLGVMSESSVQLGLVQPWVSICSDAEAVGPRSITDELTHPRAYGSFARVLGHYSRDLGLFPLAEAIRKMTSLPADTLRLADRDRLIPGAFADVIVFDPATVADRAGYEDPRRYATGMHHVLVNGQPVLADGRVLPARPGRRLRSGR